MTTEEILSVAEKSGALARKDGMYVFTKEELLWFVNDLSTTERKSISEGEVKQKAVAFAQWSYGLKRIVNEDSYDYFITNIYKG